MSQAIVKHIKTIREQRQILEDWTAYEYELDRHWGSPNKAVMYDFESLSAKWHHNLEESEIKLKTAATFGELVEITDTEVGHDLRCVMGEHKAKAALGSKNRIRNNLVRLDFYERFGRLPEAYGFALTIPRIMAPRTAAPIADLALDLIMTTYDPVALAAFGDKSDAMLYRLALN